MVQPKAEIDLQLEISKLSTPWGYLSAVALAVTTFGTIALMSGFFLKPGATFDGHVRRLRLRRASTVRRVPFHPRRV
jgi:hypothetical protein